MSRFKSTSTFAETRRNKQVHEQYHGPGGIHEAMRKFRQPLETLLNSVEVRRRHEEKILARKYADLNHPDITENQQSWIYTDITMCISSLERLSQEERGIRDIYTANVDGQHSSGLFWNQCYIDSRGSLRIL